MGMGEADREEPVVGVEPSRVKYVAEQPLPEPSAQSSVMDWALP